MAPNTLLRCSTLSHTALYSHTFDRDSALIPFITLRVQKFGSSHRPTTSQRSTKDPLDHHRSTQKFMDNLVLSCSRDNLISHTKFPFLPDGNFVWLVSGLVSGRRCGLGFRARVVTLQDNYKSTELLRSCVPPVYQNY